MPERLRIATGPVSWGVDFADAPGNPPWREVLDGIVAAGLRWTELGPAGYLPAGAAAELMSRGLGLTAGFVFEPFHDPSRRETSLGLTRAVCERVRSLGGRFLVLIDLVSPARASTAGRTHAARRLTGDARRAMVGVLGEAARVARGHGLQAVVHPHAGSYIEFEDEIERIAEDFELCLDTGHLAYAGVDPAAAYRRWAERTPYVHLKDFSADRRGPDFWSSVHAGAFRPLGSGDVDVAAFVRALDDHGFSGWVVLEQDRTPGGDPVRDLLASRQALERLR